MRQELFLRDLIVFNINLLKRSSICSSPASRHVAYFVGDKYIGNWFKGEIHGQGVKSQKDGSVLEGAALLRDVSTIPIQSSFNPSLPHHKSLNFFA